MNTPAATDSADLPAGAPVCELLILSDGTVLAHNLTPAMASILQALNPADETLKRRALLVADSSSSPSPQP